MLIRHWQFVKFGIGFKLLPEEAHPCPAGEKLSSNMDDLAAIYLTSALV
jgi:hypothetical protein